MADFTVGKYLAARLEQIGLKHYFMVPGDYNLVLLDELLENQNLEQIGCCNELNAAYAAEGYARVNGAGAVFTTYNVGAYSALNGVAGANAERLPVIMVSSSPNTNDAGENHILHHTVGTHDFTAQYEVFRQVTCAAVRIQHPDNAPAMIDRAISTALRERKPAYIEIPCNLSAAPCAAPAPFSELAVGQPSNARMLAEAVGHACDLLADAKKPILLAGVHLRSFGAIDAFRELAEALGCAVAVMPNAKGFFPEDHPQYVGIYWGEVSSPGCQAIVDWSDLVVAAGPVFSDYTTVGYSAVPPRQRLINAEPQSVRFPDAEFTGVALAEFLSDLAKKVEANEATLTQFKRLRGTQTPAPRAAAAQPEAPLSRAEMWRQIEEELDATTTLLVETGDSWLNGMYTRLPGGARFEIEMQWGSIGWSVPASFGYAMGLEDDRRLVAVIGDGSFQLTAQEVSNMIRHGQEILIFLVNNRGYVIESAIHDGPYNYYKNWNYAGLVDVFNAEDGRGLGLTANTAGELTEAIELARAHRGGPVLIECQIPNDDASPELISWGSKVARVNSRKDPRF
ncbi:MAG: thiamine pyrophosphate-binding protein [Actinomycetota bacterium]|uniref:Alpha-keto-acid decarboxylase n=1 Tax=Mycobacterium lentiflavum TaxID=141349 RepID=A0ABY3UY37_MYCLN|nr:thiamine pyrophosphate-binding protein [Mycobacterium lentiflavum]MEE3066674.1 thiamine pyrophosphate-binding protein [Actinomycetota bacterium]ULP42184.1 thiamine pyrophosphate-binding protein [Mycobacterium lentiflavum]